MSCDRCENEATVHEVTISPEGDQVEIHLCEACAQEVGLVAGSPVPVAELLKSIGAGEPAPEQRTVACDVCKTTFAQLKATGRLGCPACYKAMEEQLRPILDRAHQGAVHHVGKVPRRLVGQGEGEDEAARREVALAAAEARAEQIRRLRAELDRAVRSEQYEHAAELRDRLRRLQRGTEAQGGAS